jgi:hypothetical protein
VAADAGTAASSTISATTPPPINCRPANAHSERATITSDPTPPGNAVSTRGRQDLSNVAVFTQPLCRRANLHGFFTDRRRDLIVDENANLRATMRVSKTTLTPSANPACETAIDEAVWTIADALRPCPPHEWDSPVIMKTDPEHVGWTCRLCGTIAISDDLTVRPSGG